jgi:hypothetical protein
MPRRQSKPRPDLARRIEDNNKQLADYVQKLEYIRAEGEIAPPSCWIVRYQAKGRGGTYWYYRWMSSETIFVNSKGKPSSSKYIGKAGSQAYLNAVSMVALRGQIEAIERAINTLSEGLEDLVEEATRFTKK